MAISTSHLERKAPHYFKEFMSVLKIFDSVPATPNSTYDRPNRLKTREEGGIRWAELLDRFKSVQDKAKRAKTLHAQVEDRPLGLNSMIEPVKNKASLDIPKFAMQPPAISATGAEGLASRGHEKSKSKSSLGNLSRLARGVGQKGRK